jgi:phosphonopyruvate decarboxylase
MITANDFLAPARERGFDFYTGVPCSFLTPLINAVIGSRELTYVGAASEGEAVAIASGAWLAGRKTVVMCQNSGLGNTVNPLTSLNHPFHIPTMMVVTWRGQPGLKDEPQHVLMGQITDKLLETMRIPYAGFPTEAGAINAALDSADSTMAKSDLPFAFIMAHGTVRDDGLQTTPVKPRKRGVYSDMTNGAPPPARAAVLERLLSVAPEQAAIIATTGKTGRELFTLADRPQHLYQVGAMGAASGMALGVALNAKRKVIVLDGDGAALMKLGTFATIGAYAPKNLIHIVLDNGVHDSTGGQPTVSPHVDFAAVATACSYAAGFACDDLTGFENAFKRAVELDGPILIQAKIAPGSMDKLGRPTVAPHEVARRFKAFLASKIAVQDKATAASL